MSKNDLTDELLAKINASDSGITAEVQEQLEKIEKNLTEKADKTELFSRNYEDLNNKPTIPTTLSELENNTGFITKAVDDLVNYYQKSAVYTQEEVNSLISSIPKFNIKVVDELPQQEISAATIYLLRASKQRNNVFIEYIYVDGVWEKLGEQNIDLTGYATEKWVREQGYLTEHQDISGKADISYVDERFDSLELPETDLIILLIVKLKVIINLLQKAALTNLLKCMKLTVVSLFSILLTLTFWMKTTLKYFFQNLKTV